MSKSPLALVKELFSNKEGLVAAVKALATDELWNARRLSDKGLDHVSNKKLLHLHEVLTSVKKDHGSRAKLIDAVVEAEKRGKDAGYRSHLERASTPDLFHQLTVLKRRAKAVEAKAGPKKKAAPKKAAPKKVAPKAVAKPTTKKKGARKKGK